MPVKERPLHDAGEFSQMHLQSAQEPEVAGLLLLLRRGASEKELLRAR